MEQLSVPLRERKYNPFLLYGITGSGKTRIYIEAVAKCRQAGRQAIVLVPEIALTGQLVASFREFFAGDIVVLHSRLSVAERSDAVRRVRDKGIGIIIGARSALFTPVEDPGLIILDEEQDMSYKQDEAPRYHARTVAGIIARLYGSVLLLGSATLPGDGLPGRPRGIENFEAHPAHRQLPPAGSEVRGYAGGI